MDINITHFSNPNAAPHRFWLNEHNGVEYDFNGGTSKYFANLIWKGVPSYSRKRRVYMSEGKTFICALGEYFYRMGYTIQTTPAMYKDHKVVELEIVGQATPILELAEIA